MNINKNVARGVIDIYLNYPHINTGLSMKDFSERYNVSYPTMRKYLPLFFDLRYLPSLWYKEKTKTLLKRSEIEFYFEYSKSFIPPRDYENIMSLFFSFPTAVEFMKNKIQNLQSNN